MAKRLAWAEVVGHGPERAAMELGDQVLFSPEDRYEVEVGGEDYLILRERDIHAVAAERVEGSHRPLPVACGHARPPCIAADRRAARDGVTLRRRRAGAGHRAGGGTGQVLMMAWMNAETLRQTLDEGRTVFWSRSRQEVWRKGDTSGDGQYVREAYYDCDGDVLLFVVEQEGTAPATPARTRCFFRRFGS